MLRDPPSDDRSADWASATLRQSPRDRPVSAAFPGQERAKHMGELKRGDVRGDVYIEIQPDAEGGGGAVRGRVHVVGGEGHRTRSWSFREWAEREVQERFGKFTAVGLWHFAEAL